MPTTTQTINNVPVTGEIAQPALISMTGGTYPSDTWQVTVNYVNSQGIAVAQDVYAGNFSIDGANIVNAANALFGGGGNDQLFGGPGWDRFEFAYGSGNDQIMDFNAAEDTLVFYARNGLGADAKADAGIDGITLNNGYLTWENVTVDLNNSTLTNLSMIDIDILMI